MRFPAARSAERLDWLDSCGVPVDVAIDTLLDYNPQTCRADLDLGASVRQSLRGPAEIALAPGAARRPASWLPGGLNPRALLFPASLANVPSLPAAFPHVASDCAFA